jgi:hypothetical protein
MHFSFLSFLNVARALLGAQDFSAKRGLGKKRAGGSH